MKRISEVLYEISMNIIHKNGTYVSANLSKSSSKKLYDWVSRQNIPNLIDFKDYHSTIVYSRKGIPKAKSYDLKFPIEASIKAWKLFDSENGDKCLVALLDCQDLEKYHLEYKNKFGATYDYEKYNPHITISDKFNGNLPKEIPNINLKFNSKTFEPLISTS